MGTSTPTLGPDLRGERITAELEVPGAELGSYRLLELIGEGGMGRVYLAEHMRLGRKVALKLLRSELAANSELVSRFFAEARAVNRICHENIVEITDFIENQGGDNYYIMEFLPGRNLQQLIDDEGRLGLPRISGIIVQVCSALAAVHQAGIVHRDLKPENIFLTERGGRRDFVKLLDFGIAKLTGTGEAVPLHLTGAGTILGTPEYMSPEQGSGIEVDSRSDVYSLGVILYELLTGANPFPGENFGEMLVSRLTKTPPRPTKCDDAVPRIPRGLDDLVMQCLERDATLRPQNIAEIEAKLREIAASQSYELENFVPGTPAASRRQAAPTRVLLFAGVAIVALVAIVAGVGMRSRPPATAQPVPTPAPVAIPVAPPVVPPPVVEPPPEPKPDPVAIGKSDPPPNARPPKPGKNTPATTRRKTRSRDLDRRAVMDPFR